MRKIQAIYDLINSYWQVAIIRVDCTLASTLGLGTRVALGSSTSHEKEADNGFSKHDCGFIDGFKIGI